MLKLIGSLTSPFARKVRVTMAEKRLDYAWIEDNPWQEDNRVSASNPLGKVPCLILEGGESVFDSRVIVEYLDTLSPVGKLIPGTGRERAEIKTWEALADGVCDAAITVRLERTWEGRSAPQRNKSWIARHEAKVRAGLEAMERGLDSRMFCVGNSMTLADIATGCCLDWLSFRFPEWNWPSDHPHLAQLHARLMQRKSFQDTRPQT